MSELHGLDDMFSADIDDAFEHEMRQLFVALQSPGTTDELASEASIVAAMVHAVSPQTSSFQSSTRRAPLARAIGSRAAKVAVVTGIAVISTSAAAAAGLLPRPVQSAVERAAQYAGWNLSERDAPATTTMDIPSRPHNHDCSARGHGPPDDAAISRRRPEHDNRRTLSRLGFQHPVGHRARAQRDASIGRDGRARGARRRTTVQPVRADRFRGTADDRSDHDSTRCAAFAAAADGLDGERCERSAGERRRARDDQRDTEHVPRVAASSAWRPTAAWR